MIGEKKYGSRIGEKAESRNMGIGSRMGHGNNQPLDIDAPVEMTKIVADKK